VAAGFVAPDAPELLENSCAFPPPDTRSDGLRFRPDGVVARGRSEARRRFVSFGRVRNRGATLRGSGFAAVATLAAAEPVPFGSRGGAGTVPPTLVLGDGAGAVFVAMTTGVGVGVGAGATVGGVETGVTVAAVFSVGTAPGAFTVVVSGVLAGAGVVCAMTVAEGARPSFPMPGVC
jgi:hypothetical protein